MNIFYHPLYTEGISSESSFPRDRYRLVYESLKHFNGITFQKPERASLDPIYAVHDKNFVDSFISGSISVSDQRRIGLRPWTKDIVDRTLYIMGGSISALESCIEDGIAGNLAGGTHHSYFDYGSGYCIFNDLVICASYAKNNYNKIKKVLIVDLDVHQGDGTASMTSGDDSVFTFSMHCSSNFPLKKMVSDLDVPVSRYVTEDSYLEILESHLKKLKETQPDIVFYQAGVDTLKEDKLGHMAITKEGMEKRDNIVLNFCKELSVPVLVFMGGGYSEPITHTVDAFTNLFQRCSRYSL